MSTSDGLSQRNRIFRLLTPIMGEKYPGVGYSADFDAERNRVVVRAHSASVEVGPDEWAESDSVLSETLRSKLHGVIRANLPR